ncbi:MAG: RNA-binding cell elongation regulator Jag/EloR [Candidatus Enteromonas sp.]|nr:RNA-binding cell elongation regulator Jag/EloR [Candidatus Enteromonas sp.]
MKEYTAKTVEEAVAIAAAEFGVDQNRLIYEVKEEKKTLFTKRAVIAVYEDEDAAKYAESYLAAALAALGVPVTTSSTIEDSIIKVSLDSERNSILIGRGGKTLQALNELTKLAVSNHFKKRYRILLDVGGYKEEKYEKVASIARREARRVVRTKTDAKLDPMTPDERRIVHNALTGVEHIRTESVGQGSSRAVVIKYVD